MPTKHLWSGGLKGGVKACWSGCAGSREAEEAGVHEVSQEGFQKERRELRTNLREGREEVVQEEGPERQQVAQGEGGTEPRCPRYRTSSVGPEAEETSHRMSWGKRGFWVGVSSVEAAILLFVRETS